MDDFVVSNLYESRNEWCARLVTILTPLITEGIRSIFVEAWKMCEDSNEKTKYLMTFQNLLARIPKWNSIILDEECKRIIEKSGCDYLQDLITCVHIIQLKVLTCIRVGNKQKKIDISTPKLDHFVHRVYIQVARKVYSNIYLFEKGIPDLSMQKNKRELEMMTQECILIAIRESIPTEAIIRAYLDESIEDEEEVIIEDIPEEPVVPVATKEDVEILPIPPEELPETLAVGNLSEARVVTQRLSFNDVDEVSDGTQIKAPKTIERLQEISDERYTQRKLDEMNDGGDDDNNSGPSGNIKIHMEEDAKMDDIFDLDKNGIGNDILVLDGVEDI